MKEGGEKKPIPEIFLNNLTEEEKNIVEGKNSFDISNIDWQIRMRLVAYITYINAEPKEQQPSHLLTMIPEFEQFLDFDIPYIELKNLEEHTKAFQNKVTDLKEKLNKEIKDEKDSRLLPYKKLTLNMISEVESKFLSKQLEIISNKENIKNLESHFILNLSTLTLEPRYIFSEEKQWLDLAPSDYYFDQETLIENINICKKESYVKNRDEVIPYLETREKHVLPLNNEFEKLKNLIDTYHEIPKSDPKKTSNRINALSNIVTLSKNLSSNDDLTPNKRIELKSLASQAKNKMEYLRAVMLIPREVEKRIFRTEHIKGDPLVVDKLDWFGDLDPAHRMSPASEHFTFAWQDKMMDKLFKRWQDQRKIENNTPNLWCWMEGLTGKDAIIISKLKKDARYSVPKDEKLVVIKNGICFNKRNSNQEDNKVTDGVYLYNFDRNGSLYILPAPASHIGVGKWSKILKGKGIKDKNIEFNHNSVLLGESVKCAGCIYFKEGKIVQIDPESGHYKPSMRNLQEAVISLLAKGVFTDETIVSNFDGSQESNVTDFLIEVTTKIIEDKKTEKLKMLLDNPTIAQLVNAQQSASRKTLLMFAAENGQQNIVELLLQHGADLTLKDAQGLTALNCATGSGHKVIALFLKEKENELKKTTQSENSNKPLVFSADKNKNSSSTKNESSLPSDKRDKSTP